MAQVHALDAAETEETTVECDVVVVGTGAGGAVVGRELADRGLAVVFVEEGDFKQRDEFDGGSVKAMRQFHRATFSVGNVAMPIFVGRMVGGSTAINGATCFRTPKWVLDEWCERLGTDAFSEEAMAPSFERVEQVLDVAPPRRSSTPAPSPRSWRAVATGWAGATSPSTATRPTATGRGFCDFGCRREAKRSTQISYLPPAFEEAAPSSSPGPPSARVTIEGGKAVGVEADLRRRASVCASVRGPSSWPAAHSPRLCCS